MCVKQGEAVERATGLCSEAMTAVSAAIAAIQADDSLMLRLAVGQYRRVMTYLTVWHGRACWKADYEGANVAYPQQVVMGETLVTWGVACTVARRWTWTQGGDRA